MNQFQIQVRVLHCEPPKEAGRSGVMLVKINPSCARSMKSEGEKDESQKIVDKVMLRYPHHLHEKVELLLRESQNGTRKTVEIFGNIGGIAKRGMLGSEPYLHVELVAQRISDLVVAPAFRSKDTYLADNLLYNTAGAIGLVEATKPAEKGRPPMLYVRTGPRRADRGRQVEHTNILTFALQGPAATKIAGFEKGDAVVVNGFVTGMLRRMKGGDMVQEILEPRLVGVGIEAVSHIPASVLYDGRKRENAA